MRSGGWGSRGSRLKGEGEAERWENTPEPSRRPRGHSHSRHVSRLSSAARLRNISAAQSAIFESLQLLLGTGSAFCLAFSSERPAEGGGKKGGKIKPGRFAAGAVSRPTAPRAPPAHSRPNPLGKHKSLPTSTAASSQPPSLPSPPPPHATLFHRFLLCTPLNFSSQALQPSTPNPFSSVPSPPTSSPHIGKRKSCRGFQCTGHPLAAERAAAPTAQPGRSEPARSCPRAAQLRCSGAHTRVCAHTCHGAGHAPFASLGIAVNANFLQARVWRTNSSSCLWGQQKNRGRITREGGREGGRVYFFKQPKHGTESFHQQLLSLLCWQPAAGSSLAPALICFSLLLNALLPNIYSLLFFFFSFYLFFILHFFPQLVHRGAHSHSRPQIRSSTCGRSTKGSET